MYLIALCTNHCYVDYSKKIEKQKLKATRMKFTKIEMVSRDEGNIFFFDFTHC